MRKLTVGLLSLTLASSMGVFVAGSPALSAPSSDVPLDAAPASDSLPDLMDGKRSAARELAIQKVINGELKTEKRGNSTVVKVGNKTKSKTGRAGKASKEKVDEYVELSREKTDKIFTILAEFGNQRDPRFPDQDTDPDWPGPTRFDGPLHNEIPEPDRAKDNSTFWRQDFSKQYFESLYFATGQGVESLKTYYERQSSGRYSVEGMVSDWVKVPYNEARYGRSNHAEDHPTDPEICSDNVCQNTWYLIRDAIDVWVASQKAQGKTDAQIKALMAEYDKWDRYDHDGDGNFDEPDGYIDHFQIVHAGGDMADGDPNQGEDAIWSHRWAVFQNNTTGPDDNLLGGTQVGTTGIWVREYTIQPENGGLSVFAHEYGHDLGLPDHYDTSGPPALGENPVNWWTIMGQSRVSKPGDNAIGTRTADLSAWDKLQLGWLDYEIVVAGAPGHENRTLNLGPHEYNSRKAQAVVVVLPKKPVTSALPVPPEGTKSWWSGRGDQFTHTMTRSVTLPAGTNTLSLQAFWQIEDCGGTACDYAFVEIDDGTGWKAIPGTITRGADEGYGIDGTSGGWRPGTFDLSAYAGKTVGFRFRYSTDANTGGIGFFVDDIKITNGTTTVFADGAEATPNNWALNGFSQVGDTLTTLYDNYYIASHRTYESFDQYMRTGPYNFGFADRPDWVEHFPYQTGLLISYWDTSQSNNNTSQHPGQGRILPIDAHPDLIYRLDGAPWRPRIQGYDAPFSLKKADSFTLHYGPNSAPSYIRGQNGVATFDDSRNYYREDLTYGVRYGVKVPNHGVKIKVLSQDGTSMRVRITS